MRAKQLCHKILRNTRMHEKRIDVVSEVVDTVLTHKNLSVTKLGRKIKNSNQTRSNIRKVDRLYSNPHLLSEQEEVYKVLCKNIIQVEQPLIIIDASKLQNSPWYILRASLVMSGRAITLYEYIYEQREQKDRKLYKKFLDKLSAVLGPEISPILITDAEFRGPWFDLVREQGWDFIGRIRGNANIAIGDIDEADDWHDYWDRATSKPKKLGEGYFNRNNEVPGYFYLYKGKSKGRHAHTRTGCKSKTVKSNRHKASAIEPWLIFSSLDMPASQIIKAYKFRMTIEEGFRDTKSGRYGFGLKMTFSKQKSRYIIMLLIAAIASLIAYLMGAIGERKGLQYQFQANSIKNHRVLSRFFLGCELIYKDFKIEIRDWCDIKHYLQQELFLCFA